MVHWRGASAALFFLAALGLGLPSQANAQAGRGCSVFKPCPRGFSCHPGHQKCYHKPRREGQPCSAGYSCGSGLRCEAGSHRCRRLGKLGDRCHATRPCGSGLNCQPGVHRCYHTPRKAGEPCSAGYGCAKGFYCQSFLHKCVPKTVSYNSNSPCGALRVHAVAEDAKRANMTMSFSTGSSAGAGPFASIETGLVYGERGQFGCFVTACVGSQADANVQSFVNFGLYRRFSDFEGFSVVTGGGADIPFIELGFQTNQVWSGRVPRSAKDFAKNQLVGTSSGLSFGVGLNPVSVNMAFCFTEVLDDGKPLSGFRNMKSTLKSWGKAGFAPNRKPSALGGNRVRPQSPSPRASALRGPLVSSAPGFRCAMEGSQCRFNGVGDVYYGHGNRWVKRRFTRQAGCNNGTFGDPWVGKRKVCRVNVLKNQPKTVKPPNGAQQCASEGRMCGFQGTMDVWYGAGHRFVKKRLRGPVRCTNQVFGDPARGTRKACFIKRKGNPTLNRPHGRRCADEGGLCKFKGSRFVFYGAKKRWYVKRKNGPVKCNNGTFGDPIPGVRKSCHVQ